MHLWQILALALQLGAADRFIGGDYVTNIRNGALARISAWNAPAWLKGLVGRILKARSVVWGTLALAASLAVFGSFTVYGPKLAILALAVAAWRWDGWDAFGGGIDPKTESQILGLLDRHLLGVPGFGLAIGVITWNPLMVLAGAAAGVIFALYATVLGRVLALNERPGIDVNAYIEFARCFGLGVLLGLLLFLNHPLSGF